jgi:muramoyltetrapeptide carboxypeptidase
VGGTLALLANTVGTPEHRPARGGLAVLEDVAEPAYRIDSMLTQLLRTGWFDEVAGIVLGLVARLRAGRARDAGGAAGAAGACRWSPACPFGHAVPQLTVPTGGRGRLDADAGSLTLVQPAMR